MIILSSFLGAMMSTAVQNCPSPSPNSVPSPENITLEFVPEEYFSFDPASRELNTTVTISWDPPAESNDTVAEYILTMMSEDMWGMIVLNESVPGDTTNAAFNVSVFPYETYVVSIYAITEAGNCSSEEDSNGTRSPQAGI